MPTLSGLRRLGYTPQAIREFCLATGASKQNGVNEREMLDHFLREDLKPSAPRLHAVVKPLKVVIENYPAGQVETFDVPLNSESGSSEARELTFSREIYIESNDFMLEPIKGYKRLSPGVEVRLMHAYFITCTDVVYTENGEIDYLICTYDPATKSGTGFSERKPKGTIHFVDGSTAVPSTFRIFDGMNETEEHGFVESAVNEVAVDHFQFVRNGYFAKDGDGFNLIASLKTSFKP
jgi:glutaminyl-tRNA synthetase